ncbi:hypothetical protein [Embleya scabrispora]|uniref:hypothetical protein n=1 Tax=Embleya scabrispora TaxID=159449 RepID=UPI000361BBD5|nr:hypothetical protein [Embleya scabrispora]MYS86301.1 hypothetical protein [Streptomyces sp. SID5474]
MSEDAGAETSADPASTVGGGAPDGVGVPSAVAVIGPLDVEPPAPSGDAHVDAVLATLSRVGDLPTEAHGSVYEDVHRGLRDTLAELDR